MSKTKEALYYEQMEEEQNNDVDCVFMQSASVLEGPPEATGSPRTRDWGETLRHINYRYKAPLQPNPVPRDWKAYLLAPLPPRWKHKLNFN